MPTISVIMGIYNTKCREYLEESLNSILNQTYSDFELIICDDGSTNDCIQWAKDICKKDKRVVFLKNEKNMGLAYTLNRCLSESRGQYIARMDDDDISRLDRFEKQIRYLKEKNVDVVSSIINMFDEGGVYSTRKYPEHVSKKDFLFNSPVVHPAVMCKKESLLSVGGYRDNKKTTRVEDYDLFMRMFSDGLRIDNIQEPLLNYRDDRANTERRKVYKYRINEARIRMEGFRAIRLYPIGIPFILKPLIMGLLPVKVITLIKKRGEKW